MSQELISPETVTVDKLHALFDAALFKVSREDGSEALKIAGEQVLWVVLIESKRHLRYVGMFAIPDGPDTGERLALANRINDHLMSIRAAVSGDQKDRLCLDHYVSLDGGVTSRNIALAFKQFEELVAAAIQEVRAALADADRAKIAERQKSSFPESSTTSDKAMLASPPSPRFRQF